MAIDINYLNTRFLEKDLLSARCLLANCNHVAHEFGGVYDFSFFPLAFHLAYGNFSSTHAPIFLTNHMLAIMKNNISFRNSGTDPLSCEHFQRYFNIKQSIRHSPNNLLATKGIATAMLTLPNSNVPSSGRLAMQRQKLRRQLIGDLTSNDLNVSQPFAREERRVEASLQGEEFTFRIEQVLAIHVSWLARPLRSFSTVLQPILHLMQFFLHELEWYSHLLRLFRPVVFLGILKAFARLINVALGSLCEYIDVHGSQGATVAQAEGVAALDRLGSYCFMGFPRSLIGSVIKPLGTIDSLALGA